MPLTWISVDPIPQRNATCNIPTFLSLRFRSNPNDPRLFPTAHPAGKLGGAL